jgi:hypothetical protein
MSPIQCAVWLSRHNIGHEWIPWADDYGGPYWNDLISASPPPPYSKGLWFKTAAMIKDKLHRLYSEGPSPYLAWFLKSNFNDVVSNGIHPRDASVFLHKMDSRVAVLHSGVLDYPEHAVVRAVRGIVEAGHMFNHMCPGFIRRYFSSDLIILVEAFVYLQTGALRGGTIHESEWEALTVNNLEEKVREINALCMDSMHRFTPIERAFRYGEDGLNYMFYFGYETELQDMFPQFLVKNRLEQAQMIMSMWFLRQRNLDKVDMHLWQFMLHVGGCFPDPILPTCCDGLLEGMFGEKVLIAPPADGVRLLREVEGSHGARPPFIFNNFPFWEVREKLDIWRRANTVTPFTEREYQEQLRLNSMFTVFPLSEERQFPHPVQFLHIYMDDAPVFELDPDDQIWKDLAEFKLWYSNPHKRDLLVRWATERRLCAGIHAEDERSSLKERESALSDGMRWMSSKGGLKAWEASRLASQATAHSEATKNAESVNPQGGQAGSVGPGLKPMLGGDEGRPRGQTGRAFLLLNPASIASV